jgi:hypothetical protein
MTGLRASSTASRSTRTFHRGGLEYPGRAKDGPSRGSGHGTFVPVDYFPFGPAWSTESGRQATVSRSSVLDICPDL